MRDLEPQLVLKTNLVLDNDLARHGRNDLHDTRYEAPDGAVALLLHGYSDSNSWKMAESLTTLDS